MPKFRKKPVEVEAVQWTGENTVKLLRWINAQEHLDPPPPNVLPNADDYTLTIKTLKGEMKASKGDWIIKGIKGEFCPCKPDIFKMTYERIDD